MNFRGLIESRKKQLTLQWSFTRFISVRNIFLRLPLYWLSSLAGRVPSHPLFISYYVTSRCNLRCFMCNQEQYNKNPESGDFSGDFLRFIDTLPDRRFSLFFSGGEPFTHKDMLALIGKSKAKRFHTGVVTNGTLCSPGVIDELVRLGLDYIIFTLHGSRETHARITGSEFAYDRTVDAIRYYVENNRCGTFIVLNSAVTPLNYTALEETVFLGHEMGVDLVRFENMNFLTIGEADENRRIIGELFSGIPFMMNQHITKEIAGEMADHVADIMETPYPVRVAVKPWMTREQLRMWYSPSFSLGRGCDTLRHTLCISENGSCTACNFQRLKVGNVFEKGLDSVWRNPVFNGFRRVIARGLLPGCARCCRL